VTLPCSAAARVSREADSRPSPKAASCRASVWPALIALSIGVFEHLLDALLVLHDLAHQLLARAGQIAQLLDRPRRDQACTDQPVRQKVRDPGRVVDIAFAPGHVADMRRVSQDQLELTFEYVPYRLPVDPCRFHRHVRAARLPQPLPELEELRGRGCPAPHLAAHLTALSHPQTPHHRLFVNVQTSAALMDDFH
jgi:hypothetical protein